MMEVVLTRLRDFSCKTSTFEAAERSSCRDPPGSSERVTGSRLDIESALAWLRRELMEMRSQDQALVRQLMELHTGIQELKQELSEEEEEEEEEEEDGSCWDSESERGSGSLGSSSGDGGFALLKRPRPRYSAVLWRRTLSRRSSAP